MLECVACMFFVGRMFRFRSNMFSNINVQQMLKHLAALSTMLYCRDLSDTFPTMLYAYPSDTFF